MKASSSTWARRSGLVLRVSQHCSRRNRLSRKRLTPLAATILSTSAASGQYTAILTP